MTGNTDLIKQAVELPNGIVDLRRKEASVHFAKDLRFGAIKVTKLQKVRKQRKATTPSSALACMETCISSRCGWARKSIFSFPNEKRLQSLEACNESEGGRIHS